MNWPPPVAVAVVSWNTRALLGRCLDSLRADADAGLAAVTVVDNGSSDGSAELVAEPPARPVRPGGVTTPPGSSSVWVPEGVGGELGSDRARRLRGWDGHRVDASRGLSARRWVGNRTTRLFKPSLSAVMLLGDQRPPHKPGGRQ